MRSRQFVTMIMVLITFVIFTGCGENKFEPDAIIVVSPSAKVAQYNKVVVMGASPRSDIRRMQEQYFCNAVKGVECIQSLSFVSFGKNKDKTLDAVISKVKDISADGFVLVDSDLLTNQYSETNGLVGRGIQKDFFMKAVVTLYDAEFDAAARSVVSTQNTHKNFPKSEEALIQSAVQTFKSKGFFKK